MTSTKVFETSVTSNSCFVNYPYLGYIIDEHQYHFITNIRQTLTVQVTLLLTDVNFFTTHTHD